MNETALVREADMRKKRAALMMASVMAVGIIGTSLRANVIYQDAFTGSAGTALGGQPVAVATGADGGTANTTWNATATPVSGGDPDAVWLYSGANSVTTTSPTSLVNRDTNLITDAVLPFAPQSGLIYNLQATFQTPLASGDNGHWVGLAFIDSLNGGTSGGSAALSNDGPTGLVIVRDGLSASNGTVDVFEGTNGGTNGDTSFAPTSNSLTGGTVGTAVTVDITLNTTVSNAYTMSWSLNGVNVGNTVTLSGNPTINYVAFGNDTDPRGTVSNFSLTDNGTIATVFAWNTSTSGDWNTRANWSPSSGVPNGVGYEADFFGATSAPTTVYANTSDTVGTIHFNNSSEYLVTGAGSLAIVATAGDSGLIQVDQGTDEIDLPITFASNTSLNVASGATLIFGNPVTVNSGVAVTHTGTGTITYQSLVNILSGGSVSMDNATFAGTLSIQSGASASITANTGSVVKVAGLSIAAGGTMDINNNTLLVTYGSGGDPAASIRSLLVSGYNGNGGKWQGAGITSSMAAANPGNFSIGYADGDNPTDVANTGVAAGEVEVKYTVAGDVNLDGSVDLSDLVIVASDFGQSGADWAGGDVNYDGQVDLSDLVILASNFGASLSSVQASDFSSSFASEWNLALAEVHGADVAVPEPGIVSLALAGTAGLLARRPKAKPRQRKA
jgi:hypothetical protein